MINALRSEYSLKVLLIALDISKSSYFYQQHALSKGDKYAKVRTRLCDIFKYNYQSYGYRRMKTALSYEGIILSEKVIQRLMREEQLIFKVTRSRRYSLIRYGFYLIKQL